MASALLTISCHLSSASVEEKKKESKSLPHSFVRRFYVVFVCAFSFVSFLVTNFLFAYTRQYRQHPSKSASSVGSLTCIHTPNHNRKNSVSVVLVCVLTQFFFGEPIFSRSFLRCVCVLSIWCMQKTLQTMRRRRRRNNQMKYEERKKTVVVYASKQQAKESERLNNFEHVADWCGVRKVNTFFSLFIPIACKHDRW